jgi:DNA-binding NarL/FixJ family response regulator
MKLLILDGQPVCGYGLKAVLREKAPEVEVILVATSLSQIHKATRSASADVIILDFETLDTGISTVYHVRASYPSMKVVAFTDHVERKSVCTIVRLGAVGYLSKRSSINVIISCLLVVAEGESVFEPVALASLLEQPSYEQSLSEIERRLLVLTGNGIGIAAIGRQLAMSESTVKRRMRQLQDRLGAKTRVQAAVLAAKEGLI